MKIDLYSKFLFTVIAICLVVIVLRDVSFVSELKATPAGLTSTCSDIKANYDGSINVRIIDSDELDVKAVSSDVLSVDVRNYYDFK